MYVTEPTLQLALIPQSRHMSQTFTTGVLKMQADHMPDDVFFSVTEAMVVAGEAMESGTSTTLLVITLSDEENSAAVLGGDTSPEAIDALRSLLEQLAERTEESPEVLHITS